MLFAVIIEISDPAKTEEGSNYLTRVKIIDPSFNYKQDLSLPQLKFHKFVHVSIYSETPETAPKIKYVGDIIRLRRFRFRYSDRGELKAYEKRYSNWLIYGGQKSDTLAATCFKGFPKNIDRELNKYEEGRISDLRFWSDHFFFANSLKYISWWNDIPNMEETLDLAKNKHTETKKDLILKCTKIEAAKRKMSFVDSKGRAFEVVLNSTPALKVNEIIELKCVDLTWEAVNKQLMRVIQLTPHSSCLYIPTFFYDYRNFEKMNMGDKTGVASVKKDTNKYTFLKDFTTEGVVKTGKTTKKGDSGNFVSAIRISEKPKEVNTVSELLKIINEDASANISKKFVVVGNIIGFMSLEPAEVIKRYYPQDKTNAKLTDKVPKDKKWRIMYHLVPLVRDDSVKNDQHLQAYILTNENDNFMFDSWGILPAFDDCANWSNVKDQKIQDFTKKLNALKKPEHKVKLVLQLMMTKSNKFFYKVVDSIFIPF